MQHRVSLSVLAVVLLVGIAGCSGLRERWGRKEPSAQQVTLAQVPEPARGTIESLTAGGTIRRIEEAQEGGRTVYQVEATVQGRDVVYDVADDGTMRASGLSVPYASLPIAVRAVADMYFGFGTPRKAAVEVEDGRTFYEVESRKGRTPVTLKLAETGEIVAEQKR